MVNRVQEYDIPLGGRGIVHKRLTRKLGGEYSVLRNIEINSDGALQSRRSCYPTGINPASPQTAMDTPTAPISNPGHYIGYLREVAYFTTYDGIGITHFDTGTAMLTSTMAADLNAYADTPDGIAGGAPKWAYVRADAFYLYNRGTWWVVSGITTTGNRVIGVYRTAGGNTWVVNAVQTLWTKIADSSVDAGAHYVTSTALYKDRLWVSTINNTVYFSKTADLRTWSPESAAVPDDDAGFFKFASNVTYIRGHKDSIYVFGQEFISVIQYSDNPNNDGAVVSISDSVGSTWADRYNDYLYFVHDDALWSLIGILFS